MFVSLIFFQELDFFLNEFFFNTSYVFQSFCPFSNYHVGMSDLADYRASLAPSGTNLGCCKISVMFTLVHRDKMSRKIVLKIRDLSHLLKIWPDWKQNLIFLNMKFYSSRVPWLVEISRKYFGAQRFITPT